MYAHPSANSESTIGYMRVRYLLIKFYFQSLGSRLLP